MPRPVGSGGCWYSTTAPFDRTTHASHQTADTSSSPSSISTHSRGSFWHTRRGPAVADDGGVDGGGRSVKTTGAPTSRIQERAANAGTAGAGGEGVRASAPAPAKTPTKARSRAVAAAAPRSSSAVPACTFSICARAAFSSSSPAASSGWPSDTHSHISGQFRDRFDEA